MKYHISFSGGLGSAITALIAYEKGLDFSLLFADTLIEDEDLYRFIEDVAQAVRAPIVRLTDGRNPWEVFNAVRYHGNSRTAHCSQKLKTDQVRGWLDVHAAPNDPLVLGMDWSEEDRILRAGENWAPRPVVSLLMEYQVYRPQWAPMLEAYQIKPPRLYELGFPHNNCGGFCVRSGLAQMRLLKLKFPERYAWHEEQQEKLLADIPTTKPFIRQKINGELQYLTLKELRTMDEAQLSMFDAGAWGCSCFVD